MLLSLERSHRDGVRQSWGVSEQEDTGSRVEQGRSWADALQRRHRGLGFPYAVIRKYSDDDGARLAALITYYGFLSLFPLLILAAVTVSAVLRDDAERRSQLIDAIVPAQFQDTVNNALAALPSNGIALTVGLFGLIFSSLGLVTSTYHTLNHIAAVPHRARLEGLPRYLRTVLLLVLLVAGVAGMGTLTLAAGIQTDGARIAAFAGSTLIVFLLLWAATALLLPRRPQLSLVWPGALIGSLAIAGELTFGAAVLPRLVAKSGPIYGSFAAIVGLFTLMYLVSQVLVFAGEIAIVRGRGLWPRTLDPTSPTEADVRALGALARMQERMPVERVQARFDALPHQEDLVD